MDFKIRENRAQSQGCKPLVREREEYFRLMDQGLSSREARRVVGINLRTGKRWRNGRARRRPHHQAHKRQPRFTAPMVMISDRPAEAADRAVPGHWEGDCIVGAGHRSAIGTLVERTTRFTMLVHLPNGHRAEHFHQALTATISQLPPHLRRSLIWDQGNEMAGHQLFSTAVNMSVYFCNPASEASP
ncbi:hypothetical protein GCM10018966_068640 [Streptomyces yanii]